MCVLHSGWLTFRKSAASCRDYRCGRIFGSVWSRRPKEREVELIEGIAKIFPRLAERLTRRRSRCPAASSRCWRSRAP